MKNEIDKIFRAQKESALKSIPSFPQRVSQLVRLEKLIKENIAELNAAMNKDFGKRSEQVSLVSDILPVLIHLQYVKRNFKKWMRPQKKSPDFPFNLTGAKASITFEPLGVVCIIGSFNSPIATIFSGAIDAIGAGNRVIIKPSELAMNTAILVKSLVEKYFSFDEINIQLGGEDIGRYLTTLPFDFIMFTGNSITAREVMKSAAENITPLLLELGGKSPVVILDDSKLKFISTKLVKAKLVNSGQTCISPDYVFIRDNQLQKFIELIRNDALELLDNIDYLNVPIVDRLKYDEINQMIAEARTLGCEIITYGKEGSDREFHIIPFTLVINPPLGSSIMNNEIFGPVIPITTYDTVDYVISTINKGNKPLSLYLFGNNQKCIEKLINNIPSGGVCVNDFFLQAGQTNLPFGGVGLSGFGRYRGGRYGFDTFSNQKSIFKQGALRGLTTLMIPPFSNKIYKMYKMYLQLK